jgi:hypothetical protein
MDSESARFGSKKKIMAPTQFFKIAGVSWASLESEGGVAGVAGGYREKKALECKNTSERGT